MTFKLRPGFAAMQPGTYACPECGGLGRILDIEELPSPCPECCGGLAVPASVEDRGAYTANADLLDALTELVVISRRRHEIASEFTTHDACWIGGFNKGRLEVAELVLRHLGKVSA